MLSESIADLFSQDQARQEGSVLSGISCSFRLLSESVVGR